MAILGNIMPALKDQKLSWPMVILILSLSGSTAGFAMWKNPSADNPIQSEKLNSRISVVEFSYTTFENRLGRLEQRMERLENIVSGLAADVGNIKTDVQFIRSRTH